MAMTRTPRDGSASPRRDDGETKTAGRNDVVLVGRLSAAPTVRLLPSGDELVSWRLIVDRENRGQAPSGARLPTVDTIDCMAHRAAVRRSAVRWVGGETLEVRGALRRRFWRGSHGAASRCEVEVLEVKRLAIRETSKAPPQPARTRSGTRA